MNRKQHTIDYLLNKFMPFLRTHFNMVESHIRSHYEQWSFTHKQSPNDFMWYLFNYILQETTRKFKDLETMYYSQWLIYMEMWQLRKEEGGKGNVEMQLVHEADIRKSIAVSRYVLHVKVISKHCCFHCESFDGLLFEPEEYIKRPVLATDHCTREEGCNCTVTMERIRDSDFKLILKKK